MVEIPMLHDTPDGAEYLIQQIDALKAENERLTRELETASKLKRQYLYAANHWHERAERALAERAGGVKVPIGYALVPVEPTDRMVSAYVAAKPKGAGFNHPRKGDDKKAWFAAHEKKCRERWKAMLSVSTLTTEPAAPRPMTGDDVRRIFQPLPEDELAVLREVDPDMWGHPSTAPEGRQEAVALQPYGNMPFDELGRDVSEASIGVRRDFDFGETYPGHVMTGINFNSLNRIVSKYATRPAEQAVTKEMVNAAYNEGKSRSMTGMPNDFRAVVHAALKAAMEAGR